MQEAPAFFIQLGYCSHLGYHTDSLREYGLNNSDPITMQEKIDEHIEWHKSEVLDDIGDTLRNFEEMDCQLDVSQD